MAPTYSKTFGVMTFTSELYGTLYRKDGEVVHLGLLSRRVVTDAFAEFLVDELIAETSEWGDFKFHDQGTDNTAESTGDTALIAAAGSARVSGTQVEASSMVYRSIALIPSTDTFAIVEHGLFSQASGGTLMDRSIFAAINVINGDSIQFTYELTVKSGG